MNSPFGKAPAFQFICRGFKARVQAPAIMVFGAKNKNKNKKNFKSVSNREDAVTSKERDEALVMTPRKHGKDTWQTVHCGNTVLNVVKWNQANKQIVGPVPLI